MVKDSNFSPSNTENEKKSRRKKEEKGEKKNQDIFKIEHQLQCVSKHLHSPVRATLQSEKQVCLQRP